MPLTFYIDQYRDQIGLRVLYQQTLFAAERMRCLLEQYEYLLQQVAADPFRRIATYSLVTPAARALLPDPAQALPVPQQEPAMERLLYWAEHAPELPAVVQGSSRWSYGELGAASATELAKSLVALGCGHRGCRGGDSSPGLIAGMAAAMLSGGVLLTIDPALPARRQQVMLREAKARWLLWCDALAPAGQWEPAEGQGGSAERQSELPEGRVLWVNPAAGSLREPTSVPLVADAVLPAVDGDDPAYIFFTSGTTNVPKGVLGVHKGLSHFLAWQRTTFAVGPGDRAAQLTGALV